MPEVCFSEVMRIRAAMGRGWIMHVIRIEFNPNRNNLLARLGLDRDSEEAEDFLALLDKMAPYARPTGVFKPCAVEPSSDGKHIRVGGMEFSSALLVKNLAEEETAWAYLASCGREIYEQARAMSDPFERYWVDEIMQQALSDIEVAMDAFFSANLFSGKTASMAPGSLIEWPIQEQKPLFSLLGEGVDECGVTLTDTFLMLPNKSVSGLRFHNEHGYVSCKLCPREKCPNRRAPYEPELAM